MRTKDKISLTLAVIASLAYGSSYFRAFGQTPASVPTALTADQQVDALRRQLGQAQQQIGAANRQLGACSGDLLALQGAETAGDLVAPASVSAADKAAFEKANPGKTVDKDWKIVDKKVDK